ncbi:probable disease resistance protein At4g33300 [Cryptomeria japonica]|uniref:probable disease resistance protein At4g33300 n=1 Tax=Cryptomeria japonica TaxID=3369 RepID=UPI0027D9FC81|nr:probable disease resistance protein At4g33300 [Cryptomeria japonica]
MNLLSLCGKIENHLTELLNEATQSKTLKKNLYTDWDCKIKLALPNLLIPPLFGLGTPVDQANPRLGVKWEAPEVGWSKVNFDGASTRNPGQSGIGCILRDYDGLCIKQISEKIGVATNNEAEFRAALRGLQLWKELGVQGIHLEGDSLNVQAECKGLPLALKVIGSSLNGEPHWTWLNAKNKLSQGQSISSYHKEGLFRCLETSIDFLDDVGRECFLDLALFPENKKICADALLDICVYIRKLKWQDAFIILLELASKNLLNLISSPGSQATISYGNASELYFSQHDVMRDLAIYLGSQNSIVHRKRLFMPRKELSLPGEWEMLNDRPFNAQVVSIHTGSMAENQCYEMDFPETEVLVMHFSASEYFLPPFLKTMKKLKFVMLCNLSSKRTTLKGLDVLSSLTQIRSVRLEKLDAPSILEQIKVMQKLDKLSVSLCEGFGNISTFSNTNLQEFDLDHCSDLEEWPLDICHMPCVQIWSITNYHLVGKLPYDLGNLSSLRMLRLSALPGLKELPASVGKLGQLEFLDISLCEGLKQLPEEIGQLQNLKEFDMRECSRLRRLPRSVCGLSSLKHVICDEKIGHQWLRVKASSIPVLRVEIVEPQFTLDWLDD